MPIIARCDGCRRKFTCPDHLAGRRVKCKHCKQPFVVPTEVTPTPAASKTTAAAKTATSPKAVQASRMLAPKKAKPVSAPVQPAPPSAPPEAARSMGALESAMAMTQAAFPSEQQHYFRKPPPSLAPKLWIGGIIGVVAVMVGVAIWLAVTRPPDTLNLPWNSNPPPARPIRPASDSRPTHEHAATTTTVPTPSTMPAGAD
jgi:hypothetical protein